MSRYCKLEPSRIRQLAWQQKKHEHKIRAPLENLNLLQNAGCGFARALPPTAPFVAAVLPPNKLDGFTV
jgi:hypothetical protein